MRIVGRLFFLLTAAAALCPCPAAAQDASAAAAIQRVNVAQDGEVKVLLRALPRCFFGDLDAIRLEILGSTKPPHILLTLEPLTPRRGMEPAVSDISSAPGLYTDGFQTSLKITGLTRPAVLGLFICKDSSAEKRCSRKAVRSMDEIFQNYQSKNKSQSRPADDKIYYFARVFFDAKGNAYRISETAAGDMPREVEAALIGLGFDKQELRSALEAARNIEAKLHSVEPALKPGQLEVLLPIYAPGKCG